MGATQMSSLWQAQGECHQQHLLEGLGGTRRRAVEESLVHDWHEDSKPESGVLGAYY